MEKIYDLIIIGGGAAGLFCGAAMDSGNSQGLHASRRAHGAASGALGGPKAILESGKQLGTKLMMSGSGQCNITHGGNIKDFPAAYGQAGKKIRGCLFKYHNQHLRSALRDLGIETFQREDGKVFPVSMDAREVRDGLAKKCQANGFEIKLDCKVTGIAHRAVDDGFVVEAGGGEFHCRNLVIASGGCSYPTSGSDGAMLEILRRDLGLEVTAPKPALVPIKVERYGFGELAGIAIPGAAVSVCEQSGKKIAELSGPVLFTHSEFSGPAVLDISKYAEPGKCLRFNYVGLAAESCGERIKARMDSSGQSVSNIIADEFGLPRRFASAIVSRCGSKVRDLALGLTSDTYLISGTNGFNKAMATAGGVVLAEVDLKTMKIKKLPHLFVIGEALDIDGRTGGYNLQFAYSSACAAADNI